MSLAFRRLALASLAVTLALCFAAGTALAKTKKYKVRVDSQPSGATLYVDNNPVGPTPWEGSLAKGSHTLKLELEGYMPATRTIKVVRTRKLQSVFMPMTKKAEPPKIDVRADADKNVFGASVYIDGDPQGTAPVLITLEQGGKVLLEVKKEGFEDYQQWVTVKEDEKNTINPVLKEIAKPKFGTILVSADVADAEVYLDGEKKGETPIVLKDVSEGSHVVKVKKDPAVPFTVTVNVEANKETKVNAELEATMGGQGGTIQVLSNIAKAHVFLDGVDMGEVPVTIKDVKPGDHFVEVRAAGYQTREEKVTVNKGSSNTLKLDLNKIATAEAKIKVVSSVVGADAYIDGAPIGKVPAEQEVSSGKHFVVVKLDGYKDFEVEIEIEAGQTKTVPAELKQVARLRVISTPPGATVLINGIQQDQKTPIELNELEVGKTFVELQLEGYDVLKKEIVLEGGKPMETMSFDLQVEGMSPEEMAAEQRGLASFGAKTLPRGRSTIDLSIGYPYIGEVKVSVGAGKAGEKMGFDAGVSIRSFGARTELGLGVRVQLMENAPFTLGAFTDLYYGSRLLDDSKRNGVTWNLGGVASLTALTKVTISGRLYFNYWNDRHCPSLTDTNEFDANADPIASCEEYRQRVLIDMNPSQLTERMEELTGLEGRDMFGRESGSRIMASIVAEVALQQDYNIFFLFEGSPGQGERALFTDKFSKILFESDYELYARTGITYKF